MDVEKKLERLREIAIKLMTEGDYRGADRMIYERHVGRIELAMYLDLIPFHRYEEIMSEWEQHNPEKRKR